MVGFDDGGGVIDVDFFEESVGDVVVGLGWGGGSVDDYVGMGF